MEEQKKRGAPWLLVALIALIVALLRAPMWYAPLTRDEGIFGIIAQDCLKGYLPFTTLMENKAPLLFYLYAIPLAFTNPDNYVAIRIFATLIFMGSAVLLFIFARTFMSDKGALFCYTLYGLSSLGTGIEGFIASSELLITLPLIGSLLFLSKGEKGRSLFLSGFCLGAATMIRQTSVLYFASLLLCLVIIPISEKRKFSLRPLLMASAGFLALPLFFLILYAAKGALLDLYTGTVICALASRETPAQSLGERLLSFFQMSKGAIIENPLTFLMAVPAFIVFVLKCRDLRTKVPVILFFCASLTAINLTRTFCPKNFHQLLPFSALLVAWLFDLITSSPRRAFRLTAYAASLLMLVVFFCRIAPFLPGAPPPGRALYLTIMPESFVDAREIGIALRNATKPHEAILLYGVEPEMVFFTLRPNPMKHQLHFLLFLSGSHRKGDRSLTGWLMKFQRENLEKIRQNPPRFIVLSAPLFTYDKEVYYLPDRIDKMVAVQYRLRGTFGVYHIYKREDRK
ncbi:MAG: glycosyltransferase family 39 protein [Candidatus Eremiobacteraeota bacterium]|nr:glycosyltransferase family 39 protein [Candidatus Eremiobacteraeota bacterium]